MVYLSLGSNIGDRQLYLQLAIGLITYRVGEVKQVSNIVETPLGVLKERLFIIFAWDLKQL